MMRSREWQALALAGLATFALACGGGDQAASGDQMDSGGQDAAGAAADNQMQEPANLPEGVTMEMVTQGRQLFTGQGGCIACHGPQAKGTQLAPDLTDTTWINVSGRNYDEIVNLITTGVPQPASHPGPMPPMGGANLSSDQIHALAAYVVSLGS